MSLRPFVEPDRKVVPHHAGLSPRAVAVLGCGFNQSVGDRMPCGVGFCTRKSSFVVTLKDRKLLDPNGMFFKVVTTRTPQMEAVRNAMNEAAGYAMYDSIYEFKEPIDKEGLLAILPAMRSTHYQSKRVDKAFGNVQLTLDRVFGPDNSMVMFRYGY
jgi:hypothetical protein